MGVPSYSFNYQKVMAVESFTGAKGYLQEMCGTACFIWLANTIDVGPAGVSWGLSYLITSSMFSGHFTASRSFCKMVLGGDIVDGFMRMLMQMAGGVLGSMFFSNFTDMSMGSTDHSTPSILDWSDWTAHFHLFFALFLLCKFCSSKQEPRWFFVPVCTAIVFAFAGDGFLFVPNRIFAVNYDAFCATFMGCWDTYLTYGLWTVAAKFAMGVFSCSPVFALPEYDSEC